MATIVGSMTRAATRKDGEPLNILTAPCHERWQSGLTKTNATYYMIRCPQVKDWNFTYSRLPDNHILLNPSRGKKQIPPDVDFDLVLSHNKFGNWQVLAPLAQKLGLPLISLEHTLALPQWPDSHLAKLREMRGDLNVFISEYSAQAWGWGLDDPSVRIVHHGVDTQVFSPGAVEKKKHVLSVVNDWIKRDAFCGFKLWQEVTRDLPTRVVGDTPGLSKPAASVEDLVNTYREAQVFLNTSLFSPIPTVVLEAMACGLPIVSTNNCMLPEVIEHGVNGFLSNDPKELTGYCHLLLKDEELSRRMGAAARKTILEKFSLDNFVRNWDKIFAEAISGR